MREEARNNCVCMILLRLAYLSISAYMKNILFLRVSQYYCHKTFIPAAADCGTLYKFLVLNIVIALYDCVKFGLLQSCAHLYEKFSEYYSMHVL